VPAWRRGDEEAKLANLAERGEEPRRRGEEAMLASLALAVRNPCFCCKISAFYNLKGCSRRKEIFVPAARKMRLRSRLYERGILSACLEGRRRGSKDCEPCGRRRGAEAERRGGEEARLANLAVRSPYFSGKSLSSCILKKCSRREEIFVRAAHKMRLRSSTPRLQAGAKNPSLVYAGPQPHFARSRNKDLLAS
jgi:hypothetical protein